MLLVPLQGYHLNHTHKIPRPLGIFTTLGLVAVSTVLVVLQLGGLGRTLITSNDFYPTFLGLESTITNYFYSTVCVTSCYGSFLHDTHTQKQQTNANRMKTVLRFSGVLFYQLNAPQVQIVSDYNSSLLKKCNLHSSLKKRRPLLPISCLILHSHFHPSILCNNVCFRKRYEVLKNERNNQQDRNYWPTTRKFCIMKLLR